jgi:L-asparaginase II
MESQVLVEVERNSIVESRHRGWVAICDAAGKLVNGTHNEFPEVFIRSSLKPVQALPFLLGDGLKKFNFGLKELAVICSSHSGEPIHTETVKHILDTIGLDETYLKCGIHIPYSAEVAKELLITNKTPGPIYCNCSGKHSGMLAACLINGWPLENYYEYHHPLQKEIRNCLGHILGIDAEGLKWGIDGCGVPTYSMELNKLALLYARIVNTGFVPSEYQQYIKLIKEAFIKYPQIIAGTGRVDTVIMDALPGLVISKIGGEAVLGLGLVKEKISIAIKIEDGANRPMLPVIINSLEKIGIDSEKFHLKNLKFEPIYNNLRNQVGIVKPVLDFIVK